MDSESPSPIIRVVRLTRCGTPMIERTPTAPTGPPVSRASNERAPTESTRIGKKCSAMPADQ